MSISIPETDPPWIVKAHKNTDNVFFFRNNIIEWYGQRSIKVFGLRALTDYAETFEISIKRIVLWEGAKKVKGSYLHSSDFLGCIWFFSSNPEFPYDLEGWPGVHSRFSYFITDLRDWWEAREAKDYERADLIRRVIGPHLTVRNDHIEWIAPTY